METSNEGSLSAGYRHSEPASVEGVLSPWKSLHQIAGAAALVMAVLIPIQVAVFVASPPPNTVIGWFTLFQSNPLLGLLDMDLLLIVDQVLMTLVFLALYTVLRRANESLMAVALTLGLLGVAAYFASATAFNMLSLSNQYAAVTTDAERSMLLVAGHATVAIWQGTAFDVGYVLEGMALLITATVMLRSAAFGRRTAWVGILLGVMSLLPPTAGIVGLAFSLGSLVPLEIWAVLVGRKLLQLQ